jgi:hypothetical protein
MPPHTITAATLLVYPNKLRYSEVVSILPCLYNLPIKTVQKTLKLSHATLAKAREEKGLSRWPYESIMQERFLDKEGNVVRWEDVDRLQRETIAKVDRRVAGLLKKIADEARELRRKTCGGKRAAKEDPEEKNEDRSTPCAPPASPSDPKEEDPHTCSMDTEGNMESAKPDAEEDDGVDCLLLQALLEEDRPVPEPKFPEGSYWQGYNLELYRITDPYIDPRDLFQSTLLEWDH